MFFFFSFSCWLSGSFWFCNTFQFSCWFGESQQFSVSLSSFFFSSSLSIRLCGTHGISQAKDLEKRKQSKIERTLGMCCMNVGIGHRIDWHSIGLNGNGHWLVRYIRFKQQHWHVPAQRRIFEKNRIGLFLYAECNGFAIDGIWLSAGR